VVQARLRSQLGRLLAQLGEFGAARAELERAVPHLRSDSAEAARAMTYLGWPWLGLRPAEVHLSWLQRVADITPGSLPSLDHLSVTGDRATALLQLGEAEGWSVAADLQRRLAAEPTDPDLDRLLIRTHINLGNALDNFADVVTDPALKRQMKADAIQEYQRALEVQPRSLEGWINLGTAYFNASRRGEARLAYLRALEIKPGSVEAQFNFGNLDFVENHFPEAIARYQRVLAVDPRYVEAHVNLGLAYEKSNQLDKAKTAWRRALELHPSHPKASAKLRQYPG
jgi:tetratricopeptide (TPR) repeat protein